MAYVYWIRTEQISDLTDGYIGVTGVGLKGSMKTPEKRLKDHIKTGRFCKFAKKEELIIETIFEGSGKECFAKEKELRPSERIGWNIAPGGEGGYKGNNYVKRYGMPWREKAIQTRNTKLKEGKIKIWCKGKKLTGYNYDAVVANRKDRLPFKYEIKNELTNEICICIGLEEVMNKIRMSKSSAQKISQGKKVNGCPFILVSKQTTTYKEVQ